MGRKVEIAGEKRHLVWMKDRPDPRDRLLEVSKLKSILLPKQVDLRKTCPRVENQGDLGSCTANSSTSALEFLYRKANKPQPEFSRLFLYYATRVWISQEDPESDNGAMLRDVMKAMAKYGVCIEGMWPYKKENFFAQPPMPAKGDASNHQITYYYRCPNLRSIKACLAEGFPLVFGFSVPDSIDRAEYTGIVPYPTGHEGFIGGHAVMACGYSDKTKMLLFQNSWGEGWGEKGFGYLPYAYVENWLANDFWTIRRAEM